MYIAVAGLTINDCDFLRCKFHRGGEDDKSQISGTIFSRCRFEKCFMGGTLYTHVRFDNCNFRRCDFGAAEFIGCQFESCTFPECTAEHLSISSTELDPSSLLHGITPPYYNYGSAFDGEPSPQGLKSEWLRVRKALAAQLVKSNEEIKNAEFSDAALAALKSEALSVRFDSLRHTTLSPGVVSKALRCLASWMFLKMTKGGTSAGRLAAIALIAVTLYATLLSFSSATFQGKPCRMSELNGSAIIEQITRAAALFFAIGYTAFVGQSVTEDMLITLGSLLGLFWYALIAAVVIRRVYR
jgi:uncharacterized protein YjbI with pentapeptide repeats